MQVAILLLAAFAATAARAQDPDYCYIGEAPPDAPVNTTLPPPMDPFYAAFEVAVARFACGHGIAEDRALLDRLRQAGGCSDASEVAGYVDGLFAADSSEMKAALAKRFDTEAAAQAFCAELEICETLENGGYSASCIAALGALKN